MGYPMTYRRVINRNGLEKGGYGEVPSGLAVQVNVTDKGLATEEEFHRLIWPHAVERLKRYEGGYSMLLGDLRRLETDTVDERTTCAHIAERTGIDPDVVAAVLKEFMAW